MRAAAPPRSHRRAALAGLLVLLLPSAVAAQGRPADSAAETVARVEAAFLRNFARYVGWPARAFAGDQAPWQVCILGDNHFDQSLEATFKGRKEQGRSFEVVRASRLEQLPGCQIVFVDLPQAAQRRAALARLKQQPVLTVGHAADFLDEGGIIRLLARDRIEMSINLDQARAASLTIPSKLMEVSHEVVENGSLRRLR